MKKNQTEGQQLFFIHGHVVQSMLAHQRRMLLVPDTQGWHMHSATAASADFVVWRAFATPTMHLFFDDEYLTVNSTVFFGAVHD